MTKKISHVVLPLLFLSIISALVKAEEQKCTIGISNGWAGAYLNEVTPGVPTYSSIWQNLAKANDYDIDSDCACLFIAFAKNTFDGKYKVIRLQKGQRSKAPYNSVNYMVVCSADSDYKPGC